MKFIKYFSLLLPALGLVVLSQCSLADIRPDTIKSGFDQAAIDKGTALIAKLPEAYGGLEAWKAHKTTRLTITDTWYGFMGKMFLPWAKNGQVMKFSLMNGSDNSRVEVLDGPDQGNFLGIQNWATYTQAAGKKAVFKDDFDIKFYLPTTVYFVELPFRLTEANVIAHAGVKEHKGQKYDLVYLTWNMAEPQEKIDQYVVWINQQTGLVDFVLYTVRDFFGFIVGGMEYHDFRDVQGLKIPFKIINKEEFGGERGLHEYNIKEIQFGVDIPESEIILEPGRSGTK